MKKYPAVLAIAFTFGCAQSEPASNRDASTTPDAGGTDVGIDAGPTCGNQVLEFGEECDDGNAVDTDVCRNDCTRGPVCGDGKIEAPEECDDGNNASGDLCSGRCLEERCGNLRLDLGERCDGTPGCNATCTAVITCGNGTLDTGEQCDDANAIGWDGCSAACERERAMVLSDIDLEKNDACDLNGDGYADASLSYALGLAWTQIRPLVTGGLGTPPFYVLVMSGVEDPTLTMNDPDVRFGWVSGADANGALPDLDGTGQVRVIRNLLVNGMAPVSLSGSYTAGLVDAGPEDISIPFYGSYELRLKRARVVATPLSVTGTPPTTDISVAPLAGRICGSVSVAPFQFLPSILSGFNLPNVPTASCDRSLVPDNQINIADLVVGGVLLGNFVQIVVATQPDVDMDGDGLEQYVVVSGQDCQAVIVSCIDGDGTAIPGRACVQDPRMADTISAAFKFTAPTTTIVP